MAETAAPTERHRTRRRLETGWRFRRGDPDGAADPDHDDGDWEAVEVPHDWSIEAPFDPDAPGGRQQGFATEGVGWYRRELPAVEDGRRVLLRFDGVYRNSDVYLGGEHVGNRPSGYASFHYDVTDLVSRGHDALAVRVANDEYPHSRWYTGSGIYRHVHLVETDTLHVAPWGVDVRTPEVTDDRAEVRVLTTVRNAGASAASTTLVTEVYGPDGDLVATAETTADADVPAGADREFDQTLAVPDPERWSPDSPARYRVRSEVRRDGEPVDDRVEAFGIRTFAFTTDRGFVLNGETVPIKGVNLHHDAGCLGAAVPERALERRLEVLDGLGCNAIRTAHNPPQPELLELCDRMGFLVVDEAFDKWRHEGAERVFDDWWRADLEAMVLRDRNHPSVVCWSVGNESYDQGEDSMLADLELLADATRELDPTRPVTYGNPPWGDGREGVTENVAAVAEHCDVLSTNYQEQWWGHYREAGIDLPVFASESLPYFRGSGDEPLAFVPEHPWLAVEEHPHAAGGFVWSGIDYLGESQEWPNHGWAAGLVDTCGHPKPEANFHRSKWSDEPFVRLAVVDPDLERAVARPEWRWPPLAAHWTFQDREGSFVDVWVFSNCETVALYRDGEYLGERDVVDCENGIVRFQVPYEPGTLAARAIDRGGESGAGDGGGPNGDGEGAATHELRTAGEPAAIELSVDRTELTADGLDLAYVTATVVDGAGVRVPRADHAVHFDVSGAGELVGVDDGNLERTESYVGETRSAYRGTCTAVVQAGREPGEVDVAAASGGLDGDELAIRVERP